MPDRNSSMGFTRVWENDTKTILRVESHGEWTWVEYDCFVDDLVTVVKKLDYVVHMIILPAEKFPQGSPLPHLRRIPKILPQNVGKIIMVDGNIFFRAINTALIRVHPKMSKCILFAATVHEARSLLKNLNTA